MTEIKIRVKHRDTEVEVSVPVEQTKQAYFAEHTSKWLIDQINNIIDGIKRLEETP